MPRDPSLPEGTDQIIDTNGDVGTGSGSGSSGAPGASTSTATATGSTTMTDTNSGAGGTGNTSAFQFNEGRATGGGSTSSGGTGDVGKSGVGKAADTIVNQLKDQVSSLKDTAGERARSYAVDGKNQATDLLGKLAEILQDAAGSVEGKLGSQYSGFGNRAAEQVNALARTLDERDVDDLVEDARAFVQRSPAMALGVAAVVGFAVARVLRSTLAEVSATSTGGGTSGTTTSGALGQTGTTGTTGTTGSSTTSAGATGGLGATSGGFGMQGVGTAGTLGGTDTSGTVGTGSSAPKY